MEMKEKILKRLKELLDEFNRHLGGAAHVYLKIRHEAKQVIAKRGLENDEDIVRMFEAFDESLKSFAGVLEDKICFEVIEQIEGAFNGMIAGVQIGADDV
ncbi:hypothetical protein [Deferribacter abyssi]|uniref:hypothetical protein n=1 Tax=Deferribacter abyssi TaxID=213806 RepID=UPI003C1E8F2A